MGTEATETTRESELRRAEALLVSASTPEEVREAHGILRKAIYTQRRREKAVDGPLAQTFVVAMRIWDSEKADGVSKPERVAHLEKSLRAAWPQGREWKYLCDRCQDTGLVVRTCHRGERCNGVSLRADSAFQPHGKYRRLCTHDPDSTYTHEYGVACWCEKGKRFDVDAMPKTGGGDDFTKSTNRPMTRAGR